MLPRAWQRSRNETRHTIHVHLIVGCTEQRVAWYRQRGHSGWRAVWWMCTDPACVNDDYVRTRLSFLDAGHKVAMTFLAHKLHTTCHTRISSSYLLLLHWHAINAACSVNNPMPTRMWANAQHDGRPAKYRRRPLLNTAKYDWHPLLECRAVMLPRRETRWNLQGCPKLPNRCQPLVGQSSPYYQDM